MVNQGVYNILTGSWIWNHCNNSVDCCVGRNINSAFKNVVRNNYGIGYNEEIVSIRDTTFWGNNNQGAVVTDCGIRCIPDNENNSGPICVSWNDVEYVTYKDYILYFWGYGEKIEDNCASFHINYFVKDSNSWDSVGLELQKVFSKAAALLQPQLSPLDAEYNKTKECYEKSDYDTAIQCANNMLGMTDDVDYIFQANLYKAHSLKQKALLIDFTNIANDEEFNVKEDELISYLNDSFTSFSNLLERADTKDWVFNEQGELHRILALRRVNYGYPGGISVFNARRLFIGALNTQDDNIRKEVMEKYDDLTGYMFDDGFDLFALQDNVLKEQYGELELSECREIAESRKFTKVIPFSDRQFVIFAKNKNQVGGLYDISDNIKWVFTLDRYPKDISFEGYLEPNVLYMAHPVRTGLYLQFEGAEDKLFMDKIREFCYLVQCLGATEVSFKSIRGKQITSSSNIDSSIHGEMSSFIAKGDGTVTAQNGSNVQFEGNQSVGLNQRFSPQKYPYCPDDLAWLNTDSTWQMLVKQRLEGNMLNYHYRISSSETCQMSNSRFDDVKGSFEYMMLSANANYNSKTDTTFSKHEESEWEITVTFKPIQEFGQDINNSSDSPMLNTAETEYLNELKEILADGEISPRERRLLDKIRVSLGITENRAKELEDSLTPKLTLEEQEYLDEYREIIAGGEILPRDQRFLEKLKKANGISDKRALEIEKLI